MTKSQESKVRDYLTFLSNPDSTVNQTLVAKLQTQFDNSEDPLERLQIYPKLEAAQRPDGSQVEADFIEVALAWAERKGVDAKAFREVHNVPTRVLHAAGFKLRSGEYKERTSSGIVQDHIKAIKKGEPFTIKQVAEEVNASVAGVRNVVKEMIELGTVTVLPKDEDAEYTGRPAIRYARTG